MDLSDFCIAAMAEWSNASRTFAVSFIDDAAPSQIRDGHPHISPFTHGYDDGVSAIQEGQAAERQANANLPGRCL